VYNLYKLIIKNFKLLLRSKSSALIVIFGPLLIIFFAGIAFDNTNTYSISIGVYSSSYSPDSESFIAKLNENEFEVIRVDSEQMCLDDITRGRLHTCIVFPPDMDVKDSKQTNEVVFLVDYSKINLVYMVLDTLSEKLQSRNEEISKDLTSVILEKLDKTRTEIFNKNPDIVTLKSNVESQKIEANTIKSQADGLDLSFDEGSFKVTEMQTYASSIKTDVNSLKSYLATKINASKQGVVDAKNELADIVNSSEVNDVEDELDSIEADLTLAENKTLDLTGMQIVEIDQIITLLSSADQEISSVKSKINAVGAAKTKINEKVGSMITSLDSSSKLLDGIKTTFSNIDKNIASIPVVNADKIVSPITTSIKPVSVKKTHLNYIFPSLIVLVIMFISILLSTTLVMMEKHSPAYFRNFITPVNNFTYIVSIYITTLILVALQLIIILSVSSYFFQGQIFSNLVNISLMLFLLSTVFILLGMFVGYIFNSEETGTLASIFVGSIFLFLSDLILPIESMPKYILNIARFNPFVIGQNLLRKTIIFGYKLEPLADDIYLLAGYSALILICILFYFTLSRQTFFSKWSYRRMMKRNAPKNEKPDEPKKKVKRGKKGFVADITKEHDTEHKGGGFLKYLRK